MPLARSNKPYIFHDAFPHDNSPLTINTRCIFANTPCILIAACNDANYTLLFSPRDEKEAFLLGRTDERDARKLSPFRAIRFDSRDSDVAAIHADALETLTAFMDVVAFYGSALCVTQEVAREGARAHSHPRERRKTGILRREERSNVRSVLLCGALLSGRYEKIFYAEIVQRYLT